MTQEFYWYPGESPQNEMGEFQSWTISDPPLDYWSEEYYWSPEDASNIILIEVDLYWAVVDGHIDPN